MRREVVLSTGKKYGRRIIVDLVSRERLHVDDFIPSAFMPFK